MKKQLLLSSLLAFTGLGISHAQITLTQSDMPQAGMVVVTANDTAYNGTPGASGVNQTWSFGSLGNHGLGETQFEPANTQPGFSNFPTSTLCIPSLTDSTWSFLTVNSGGAYIDGLYSTSTSFPAPVIKYNPPLQLISLPCTYNTSYTSNSMASFKLALNSPPVDSLEYRSYVMRNSVIDAWGSVTTPTGTYNALRQKVLADQIDSTFIYMFGMWIFNDETVHPTETLYSWWANNQYSPVLEMTDDGNGVQGSVSYLVSSAIGLREINKEQTSIITYPNPSQSEIHFVLPQGNATLQMMDVTGKVIRSMEVSGAEVTLDVSTLQNGAYSFRYISATGNNMNGKLIINH